MTSPSTISRLLRLGTVAVTAAAPLEWSHAQVGLPHLPLPEDSGFGGGAYSNPLLLFEEGQIPPPEQFNNTSPDDLPSVSPYMPGEVPRPQVNPEPLSAEELELMALASKVAGSVVNIKVWDEYGGLLASGVGCFVSQDGLILTDTSMVHPEFAERIDYITTTAADGSNHRVSGFYQADLRSGVTLLQTEGPSQPALQLRTEVNFDTPINCHVLAVSDSRGLVLAEARIQKEQTLAGQGWLAVTGEDSPGATGSPVLAKDGSVLAVVGMKTPLKSWMNFALPCEMAAYELQRKRPLLKPLSQLPAEPTLTTVRSDKEFLSAFDLLSRKRTESAVRKLLGLTNRYPRSAECWALLGLGASALGATPDALSCQRKAVALDPLAGLYWHQLALAKLRSGRSTPDDTEDFEAVEQAIDRNPRDRIGWLLLASHHLKQDRLDDAEDALKRLSYLAPSYAPTFYLLAYVKGRQQDYDGAARAIERCLDLNGRMPSAWYYLGLIEDHRGEPLKAAAAYKNTIRYQPYHPQAWLNMAHSLKKGRRVNEAREAFATHIEVQEQIAKLREASTP